MVLIFNGFYESVIFFILLSKFFKKIIKIDLNKINLILNKKNHDF